MKTLKLVSIAALFQLFGMNSSVVAQTTNTMQPVFEQYFSLKDALINSDLKSSQSEAKVLLEKLSNVSSVNMNKEQLSFWDKNKKEVITLTKSMSTAKNIDEVRKQFSKLSDVFYAMSTPFKFPSTIYLQKCPMYNSGKGATWLSKEQNIRNPYYGQQMLNCGKVLVTIK